MIGMGSGMAAECILAHGARTSAYAPRHEARRSQGAGHRRSKRDRRGDRAPARGRGGERRDRRLDAGAGEVAEEVGGEAVQLDVTEVASVAAVVEALGPFEVLVNNAGTDEFGFFTRPTRVFGSG